MSREIRMRRLAQRGMVVALAAGLAAAAIAQTASQSATHTTLTAETQENSGRTVATFSATVLGESGEPAAGAVTLVEHGQSIAGAALNAEGKVEIKLDSLTAGDHALKAVYAGSSAHATSQSENVVVHPQAVATPDFGLAIDTASMTIAAPGDTGNLKVTITSINGFTGFISLSCSGEPISSGAPGGAALPVGVSCIFTPANLQVIPSTSNPTGAVTAQMSLQTTAPAGQNAKNRVPGEGSPLVLAVLLPGVLGLGLLGRKRGLFGRAALLVMVGAISLMGATACSARYSYFHHPPTANDGTPPGTYTLTVTAQTSNGVTATSHDTPLALTVE